MTAILNEPLLVEVSPDADTTHQSTAKDPVNNNALVTEVALNVISHDEEPVDKSKARRILKLISLPITLPIAIPLAIVVGLVCVILSAIRGFIQLCLSACKRNFD